MFKAVISHIRGYISFFLSFCSIFLILQGEIIDVSVWNVGECLVVASNKERGTNLHLCEQRNVKSAVLDAQFLQDTVHILLKLLFLCCKNCVFDGAQKRQLCNFIHLSRLQISYTHPLECTILVTQPPVADHFSEFENPMPNIQSDCFYDLVKINIL